MMKILTLEVQKMKRSIFNKFHAFKKVMPDICGISKWRHFGVPGNELTK